MITHRQAQIRAQIRARQRLDFQSISHYVWPMPVNRKLGKVSKHTTGPLPKMEDNVQAIKQELSSSESNGKTSFPFS